MALDSDRGQESLEQLAELFRFSPQMERYGTDGMKFRSRISLERQRLKNKYPSINPGRALGTKLAIN